MSKDSQTVLVVAVSELLRIGERHLVPSEQEAANKPISRNVLMGERAPPLARYIHDLLQASTWMPRPDAEKDPAYRQLIPYVVIQYPTDDRVLAYHRPKKGGGEARLRGSRSVGFGGHVHPSDEPPGATGTNGAFTRHHTIRNAMLRELKEELGIEDATPTLRGTICLHNSDVDRVHLGLRYVWKPTTPPDLTLASAAEVLDPKWLSPLYALVDPDLESWSKHCLEAMRDLDAHLDTFV